MRTDVTQLREEKLFGVGIKINKNLFCCLDLRYTSGDVRLWDTLHWDSTASYLKTNSLSANTDPRPHVSHVQVNNSVAAAAYEDGKLCIRRSATVVCCRLSVYYLLQE